MMTCGLCGGNTAFLIYIDRLELSLEVCDECYREYNEGEADWLESRMEDNE